jgi:glucose/arabinose dehydrogenase
MVGGDTNDWRETPLSAAVLACDVRSLLAGDRSLPVNVCTDPPVKYDPSAADAPVQVIATGIREAYDLCWHSNGCLYAGVNMNDTGDSSPARDGVPALKGIRADEMLIRIRPGSYYGHPNPSLGRHVLLGGNPTPGVDPWEVSAYPVGVQPEPSFDPSLLIYNLAKIGGPSANGCLEYRGNGPLRGQLLICFYTSTRTICAFTLSRNGAMVLSHEHLRDRDGRDLKFGAPLDIAQDARGRLYVADFSDPRRGDSGRDGGVWVLLPQE